MHLWPDARGLRETDTWDIFVLNSFRHYSEYYIYDKIRYSK